VTATLLLPLTTFADHLDIIQLRLKEGCSVTQYVAIMKDFNDDWAKKYGYRAELAVPLQSDDLVTIVWVGRSANAAAFGQAWDVWRDALADPESLPAKLQARFDACAVDKSRRSYDVY
jgi:hypothetical protein